MDITFCDLCNESVPQADVELGWAVKRSGRLICSRCDAAMSGGSASERGATALAVARVDEARPGGGTAVGGPERPPGNGRSARTGPKEAGEAGVSEGPAPGAVPAASGSGVGWVALVFGTAAIAFLVDSGREAQVDIDRRFDRVVQEAAQAEVRGERRAARLSEDLERAESRLRRALTAELEPVQAGISDLRDEVQRQSLRWEDLKQELELARADANARHSTAELTFERQSAQLKRIDEDLRFYRDRIIELEEGVRGIAKGGVPFSLLPGGGETTPADGSPRWSGLLPDLEHASAAIRLEAVYALGDTKDPLVVPHLIPRLDDADMFVRLATARILEALSAKRAVPDLIDALEDRESAVREAAVSALRTITGRSFRFDPLAGEGERADAVRDWRGWWERASSSFLEEAGGSAG